MHQVQKFSSHYKSLNNFRYSVNSNEYIPLSKEQINAIYSMALIQDNITYKKIVNIIGLDGIQIKGLKLSKSQYVKCLEKLKTKHKIPKNEKVDINSLSQNMIEDFNILKTDEMLNKSFISLPTYSLFRKEISKIFGTDEWEKLKNKFDIMDEIIRLLTIYKTDETLEENLIKSSLINEKYFDFIKGMPNFTDHIKISLKLISQLIPLLLEGKTYDKAMESLGLSHSTFDQTIKFDILPSIMINNDLKNQRVIRSLSQTRKIINAVIKKYGKPFQINIEVATELAKSYKERNAIERNQLENQEDNIKIKQSLLNTFNTKFKTINDVKGNDVLKYKLWVEQEEYCIYSGEKITINELFDNNAVQIDHILPYSRTYNDNYLNKTLVKTKYNQIKGDRTPSEWLKNTDMYKPFEDFVLNSNKIPYQKKVNYLFRNLNNEAEKEFKNQNLNDTKYISKYLISFINSYLNVESVLSVKGGITAKLRARWGMNNLTRSLQSSNFIIDNNDKKNRDNYLHHILDACIIAATTPTLINRVSNYEKYKRYFKNNILMQASEFSELKKTITYFIKETGEVVDDKDLNEFIDDAIKNEFMVKGKNRVFLNYPIPYKDFVAETKLRIYERNVNLLRKELSLLDNYKMIDTTNINVIIPTLAKNKISGALHKETYYGIHSDSNTTYLTERLGVNSPRFNMNILIEKTVDVDAGAKDVVNVLKNWLKGYKNGEDAYKALGYPVNEKTGNSIKKIKIITREFGNKGHILENKIVASDIVFKIEVFKKENDDKLYFVGYDLMNINKIKNNKTEDLYLTVWSGQGNNFEIILYNDLHKEYTSYIELFKNDLILIEKNDGTKGLAYANGFSSGKFEVKSLLKDGYDLISSNLFASHLSQYALTISTLKSIKKVNISILGKIEGEY